MFAGLSSQAFLAALDRMMIRRPDVVNIYSDNATNFTGSARLIAEALELWRSSNIANELTLKGITWTFNTPLAPHHGGLWEAVVKSFKQHFAEVTNTVALTFEELYTIIVRIEACLNSRPLAPLSDDPADLTMLTPGHLINGGQLIAPLPPSTTDPPTGGRIDWKVIRSIEDDIWQRWQNDYLSTLQLRNKWCTTQANLKIGDFVIIDERNLPSAQWKKGRITAIFPGKDGLVRSVEVKTAAGKYQRPITRICVLPTNPLDEESSSQKA